MSDEDENLVDSISAKKDSTDQVAPRGQKRKSIADLFADTAAADRQSRMDLFKKSAKEKARRLSTRENTKLQIERVRLDHQAQQAEAQRAHEMKMIERQIELERLRSAFHASPAASHTPPVGHPFGPPPGNWLDSSLH